MAERKGKDPPDGELVFLPDLSRWPTSMHNTATTLSMINVPYPDFAGLLKQSSSVSSLELTGFLSLLFGSLYRNMTQPMLNRLYHNPVITVLSSFHFSYVSAVFSRITIIL